MNPGIYPNTSRADYDAVEAVNQSTIKKFMPNPWAWKQGLKPFEDTASVIHGRLVEAHLFDDAAELSRYASLDSLEIKEMMSKAKARGHKGGFSKQLKEYQQWKVEQVSVHGRAVIDEASWFAAQYAAANLREDPGIREYLDAKTLETNVMIVWRDPDTDLLCKALVDCHARPDDCLCDIKTSAAIMGRCLEDAARKFYYQCLDLGYDIQAGAYLDGWEQARILRTPKYGWRFIVSGNEAPYPAARFSASERMIEEGRAKWRAGLKLWKQCHETGEFPGLTSNIAAWVTLEGENFKR